MREQKVVVAIVQDSFGGFLVTFNVNWNGYAFPMIEIAKGETLASLAIKAVEHDLGQGLPAATAKEFSYMSRIGVSQRTGEETLYHLLIRLRRTVLEELIDLGRRRRQPGQREGDPANERWPIRLRRQLQPAPQGGHRTHGVTSSYACSRSRSSSARS